MTDEVIEMIRLSDQWGLCTFSEPTLRAVLCRILATAQMDEPTGELLVP